MTNTFQNSTVAVTTSSWQYYPQDVQIGTVIVNTPMPVENGVEMNYRSPSGVDGEVSFHKDVKGIHPKLYFSYVKSKFNKLEKEKLIKRINKLRSMVISADEMNQQALYERLALMLAIAARESEAQVCGFEKWVHKNDVNKFIGSVKGKTIKFDKLENFPRLIPDGIKKKIKSCKLKKVFDEYWIVYTDYTEEKIKTIKEKIREKDPIVFGTFSFQENVLYVIGDWVDEYCDITVDKMVDKLRKDNPEYNLGSISELSKKDLVALVEEVKIRHKRLKETNPSNYKDNMVLEESFRSSRKKKPSFAKKILDKVRGK